MLKIILAIAGVVIFGIIVSKSMGGMVPINYSEDGIPMGNQYHTKLKLDDRINYREAKRIHRRGHKVPHDIIGIYGFVKHDGSIHVAYTHNLNTSLHMVLSQVPYRPDVVYTFRHKSSDIPSIREKRNWMRYLLENGLEPVNFTETARITGEQFADDEFKLNLERHYIQLMNERIFGKLDVNYMNVDEFVTGGYGMEPGVVILENQETQSKLVEPVGNGHQRIVQHFKGTGHPVIYEDSQKGDRFKVAFIPTDNNEIEAERAMNIIPDYDLKYYTSSY